MPPLLDRLRAASPPTSIVVVLLQTHGGAVFRHRRLLPGAPLRRRAIPATMAGGAVFSGDAVFRQQWSVSGDVLEF
jgi:hypothetical protein